MISALIFALSLHLAMAADCGRTLAGRLAAHFTNVSVDGGRLLVQGSQVPGTYYLDKSGRLFDSRGVEIVSISAQRCFGGREWCLEHRREYAYYPEHDTTVRLVEDLRFIGLGDDHYVYFDGVRCTNLGTEFYMHKGRLYDSKSGRKVQTVEIRRDGTCRIELKVGLFG